MALKKPKKEAGTVAPKITAQSQPAPAKPTTPPQAGDLTIADLKNIGTIIDVASSRGAFRANEMATVGLIYNKLQMFLAKVAPETKPEENAKPQGPAAAAK